jgi:hypothetical protein
MSLVGSTPTGHPNERLHSDAKNASQEGSGIDMKHPSIKHDEVNFGP